MPFDPERGYAAATYRTKQVIVLAADVLLGEIASGPVDRVADRLVAGRVLPACYRSRYDEAFVASFRGVVELTRNLLVSDAPFLPDSACELAAHAIFRQAEAIVAGKGRQWHSEAAAIDEALADQLERNHVWLAAEVESLKDAAFEDWDVLALFDLPAGEDPIAHLDAQLRPEERLALRFENWRVPFGTAPRPQISYDARAWSLAL
jgi:hypothetical protein